jgi:hypothetical protein
MSDQTNAVTVTFRLASSDVFLALARHMMRGMWFLLPLLFLAPISAIWSIIDPANDAVSATSGSVVFLIGVLVFTGVPYLQTRALMKTPNFGGPMTLTVTEQGIGFVGEHSNANIGWAFVKGVSETKRAILIHLKMAGFQIVPKNRIPNADVEAVKNVLRLYAPGKVKLAKA